MVEQRRELSTSGRHASALTLSCGPTANCVLFVQELSRIFPLVEDLPAEKQAAVSPNFLSVRVSLLSIAPPLPSWYDMHHR